MATIEACTKKTQNALLYSGTVKASNTIRQYYPVKFDTGYLVESEGTTDACIGIAMSAGNGDVAKQSVIAVALLGSSAIVPVLIGVGGITQGAYVTPGNEGAIAITPGGGSTKKMVIGQAMDAADADGYAGVNLALAHTCGTA